MLMATKATLIYELLPALRKEQGLSVAALARRSGVGEKTIQTLENGKNAGRIPEAATIEHLADALRVAPDRFYEHPIAVARLSRRADGAQARRRLEESLRERAQRKSARPASTDEATPNRDDPPEVS